VQLAYSMKNLFIYK